MSLCFKLDSQKVCIIPFDETLRKLREKFQEIEVFIDANKQTVTVTVIGNPISLYYWINSFYSEMSHGGMIV
jgi:hypothetical protein